MQIGSHDLIVMTEGGFVGAIGVEDLIIVRSGDAVLVCHKDKAQDIKKLVQNMSEQGFDKYLQ